MGSTSSTLGALSSRTAATDQPRFRVRSVEGGAAFELAPDHGAPSHVIGRGDTASIRLPDNRVSRKHAELKQTPDGWEVCDLGSRSGTYLNGRKLQPGEHAALELGAVLSIGPFGMRLISGAVPAKSVLLHDDAADSRVSAILQRDMGELASHRLQLLLGLAGQLHRTRDLDEALDLIAAALLSGTGYTRALLLRDGADGAVRLAGRAVSPEAWNAPLSRSLLAAARSTRTSVRLDDRRDLRAAVSIQISGVSNALCIPIVPASDDPLSQQTLVYLDLMGGTDAPEADAASYARAACDLAALYIESDGHRALQAEVDAMRQVQLRMMPAQEVELGSLSMVARSLPGRGAAGDILGVCRTIDGGWVLIVGDVSGKGPAAAMLMACVVAHMNAFLVHRADLPAALASVNTYIVERFEGERFATAVAIHARKDGTLQIVDAGHGFLIRVSSNGTAAAWRAAGGPPLGSVADQEYEVEEMSLAPGERLVICTDGVTEQNSAKSAMFGMDGAVASLQGSSSAGEDVDVIIAALRKHAGQPTFDDDVTVVSVAVSGMTQA